MNRDDAFEELLDILLLITDGMTTSKSGRDYLRESIEDLRVRYKEATDT